MDDKDFQFTPEEQWGEVGQIRPTMNWPQAIANIVTVICVAAVLIVLFMVLWGPW